jgi:hypothetical protein
MTLIVTLCALVAAGETPPPCTRHAVPVESAVLCPPPTPGLARPGWRVAGWRCERR